MVDSYLFTVPWTNEVEEAIKTWLSQTYEQRENEEPDQEFLQYVMVHYLFSILHTMRL